MTLDFFHTKNILKWQKITISERENLNMSNLRTEIRTIWIIRYFKIFISTDFLSETKYVGNNIKILVTDLNIFVTNTLFFGITVERSWHQNIQNCHRKMDFTNILFPI